MKLILTAGRGPVECRQAVAGIARALQAEMQIQGWHTEVFSQYDTDHGPLSLALSAQGPGVDAFLTSLQGTMCWVCPSPRRGKQSRRRWFIGVYAVEDATLELPTLHAKDLVWETLRAGGPGGQHQNTTDSAVRVLHRPSGLVVVVREERSQHRNRAKALERLQGLLWGHYLWHAKQQDQAAWRHHSEVERGNPTRLYEGPMFRKVS